MFIDEKKVEKEIDDLIVKNSNGLYNQSDIKLFGKTIKTKEFYKLENEARKEVLTKYYNKSINKLALSVINKISIVDENIIINNLTNKITNNLSFDLVRFKTTSNLEYINGINFNRFKRFLKNKHFLEDLHILKDKKNPQNKKMISFNDYYLSITNNSIKFFIDAKTYSYFCKFLKDNGYQDTYLNENLEYCHLREDLINKLNLLVNITKIKKALEKKFDSETVIDLISKNPNNVDFLEILNVHKEIKDKIPSDLTMLFPNARVLKRHFILHIGDTNTGKTYQALEELKKAKSGTYLAPLRLLALEVQERLNNDGVLCSMTTGEEEDIIEGATHMSSTVEKLDIDKKYDLCVIDEAQMINDDQRGWAWTNAILGVNCERIHVCMAASAKDIIIKLINLCNDTYEIVEHTRNTSLVFEKYSFDYPNDIKDHDALIVFSRKNVLAVASELESKGINASVIYGALPYSVRKNEIRKFIEGETKVVVSTDAIGMGLNLPIKRIIFLESMKFDGKQSRYLNNSEVRQIAGRAGRRGQFDVGYVNAAIDGDMIESLLNMEYKSIKYARIQLPKALLTIDMSLIDIMKNWMAYPDSDCFKKSILDEDLPLCKLLENTKGLNLSKEAMLDLINIPFEKRNDKFIELWMKLIKVFYNGGSIEKEIYVENPNNELSLDEAETLYKKLDLLYSFCRTVGYNENDYIKRINILKEETSLIIIEKLKTKQMTRKCNGCGRVLPWNTKYSICDKCFKKRNYYSTNWWN